MTEEEISLNSLVTSGSKTPARYADEVFEASNPRERCDRIGRVLAEAICVLLVVGFGNASVVRAQVEERDKLAEVAGEPSKKEQDRYGWRWNFDLEVDGAYDSNVFLLSDGTIDRFKQDNAGDKTSGRFADVSEVDDFVVTADAELRAAGNGFGNRRLEAWISLDYDQAVFNEVRSHPRFGAGVSQRLGKGRKASIEFEYELDRFRRNYLSGTSPSPGGQISASERRYRAGTFSTAEIVAGYGHRLWKRKKKRPSRLADLGLRQIDLEARLGYARRDFDHFSNRDRDEFILGLGLEARVGKKWRVEVDYGLTSITTSRDFEFLILDEPDVGLSLNGDADATDQNVPIFARVDRSRIDHTVGIDAAWQALKSVALKAGYDFTFQDYLSEARLDLTYNGREDERHRVFGEIEWSFAKRWAASIRGGWMDESSDRREVADQFEETSYDRYTIGLGVSHRF